MYNSKQDKYFIALKKASIFYENKNDISVNVFSAIAGEVQIAYEYSLNNIISAQVLGGYTFRDFMVETIRLGLDAMDHEYETSPVYGVNFKLFREALNFLLSDILEYKQYIKNTENRLFMKLLILDRRLKKEEFDTYWNTTSFTIIFGRQVVIGSTKPSFLLDYYLDLGYLLENLSFVTTTQDLFMNESFEMEEIRNSRDFSITILIGCRLGLGI